MVTVPYDAGRIDVRAPGDFEIKKLETHGSRRRLQTGER